MSELDQLVQVASELVALVKIAVSAASTLLEFMVSARQQLGSEGVQLLAPRSSCVWVCAPVREV